MKTIRKICLFAVLLISFTAILSGQDYVNERMKAAKEVFAAEDEASTFVDNLNHVDMTALPIFVRKTVGNVRVTIALSSIEAHPQYEMASIFAKIEIGTKDTIFFGATGIKFTYEGDIIGDARLSLFGDKEKPICGGNVILRLKGSFDENTGQSTDLTYITIDCNGFKDLELAAEIELSPKLCSPVKANGTVDRKGKVIGKFQTHIERFDDILAKVDFPAFEIKGLSGFVWNLRDAVFDFSDLRNDNTVTFPLGYSQYLIPGNEMLWNGVYVKELSITLPPQFAKNNNDTVAAYANRVSFMAQNMIIDDNGITGLFGAENILPINEGNASGWEFSVDHFHLRFMANSLEEANFKGKIGLPISEKTRFAYDGLITANDEYYLKVSTMSKINFDVFKAQAEIDPNSYVELKVKDNKFRPSAVLHGRMGIYISKKDANADSTSVALPNTDSISVDSTNDASAKALLEFKGIEFKNLKLQTEAPYLSVEYFGYKGNVGLAGFPVSLNGIDLKVTEHEARLGFGLDLSLMDLDLGATTRVEIVGKLQQGKLSKWKFKGVKISDISIYRTIAKTMSLKGLLSITSDDPIYGDCFSGNLDIEFVSGPTKGIKAKMRGMFGKKDFRYWFVDGIANCPSGYGVPVVPGALFITGLGGGLTYKMKAIETTTSGNTSLMGAMSMQYKPDENCNLQIKAATAFAVVNDQVATGEACFELTFNNSGGLNYAGFYGYTKFVGKIPGLDKFQDNILSKYKNLVKKELAYLGKGKTQGDLTKLKQHNPNEAGRLYSEDDKIGDADIKAALGIQYNFAESSFHATFDLYVSVANGLLKGVASENRAGYAVLHVDSNEKYIHMGTPTDRIGLKFALGRLLNVETGAYIMVGNRIPNAPGLPPQVAAILNEPAGNLDYMGNLNALEAGKGFAFGANFSVNTGDISFLILYARFAAGMGFDIMLKDYGDAECKGRSGAIGLDGWYANGQAYAYLSGELGVKINLWFIKAKVPIITADFAALMQAKLPNPSSFKAYIAVKAKVLGLVKVNCRFKLSIGEECELVIPGGSPLDMIMITDLSPTDASSDISVFTAPQATFAMDIGKEFRVQDDEGEKIFRIQLKDFVVKDEGNNVIGNLKWNADKDEVSFYSHEILPKQKELTATVRVSFEEYKSNRWNSVYTAGKEALETKTIKFTTGDAPEDIPMQNIVYAYPVVDQKYYLKDESNKGYIQLQFGQNYLFPADLDNKVCIEDDANNKQYADFIYNESKKRIDFTMPESKNGTAYKFSILSMSKGGTLADNNTTDNSQSILNDDEYGNIDIESRKATAQDRTDIGKTLLAYDFASSRYSTFKQKIDNIVKGSAAVVKLDSDVLMFEYETVGMEPFDLADLTGTDRTENKPLIAVAATLNDYFYTGKVRPLLYEDYPVQGQVNITNRDETIYGTPPVKALPIMTTYLNQIENNNFTGLATRRFPYHYNLPQVYKFDFIDLQSQVINKYMSSPNNPAYQRFVKATYPFISAGDYKINMQYIMPGGVTGTTSTFDYKNFIQ